MRDNIQELLKVRYKVIADYPGNNLYAVGSIIEDTGWGVELFPHLFRRLEWWEDRDVKDMPEYVRSKIRVNKIFRLSDISQWQFSLYLPATETDYLNQTPQP